MDLSDYLGDEYEEFDDEVEVEASDMNDGFEKIQKEWARQYGDVCKVGEDNDYEYDNNNYHFFLSLAFTHRPFISRTSTLIELSP